MRYLDSLGCGSWWFRCDDQRGSRALTCLHICIPAAVLDIRLSCSPFPSAVHISSILSLVLTRLSHPPHPHFRNPSTTPKMHMQVVHNAYTPKETTELCSRAGTIKANMRVDKVFMSSFMAGCLLAFACACSLSVSVSPWYQENAPGMIALLGAIIFPWGLVAILSTGADLCTGSFMVSPIEISI